MRGTPELFEVQPPPFARADREAAITRNADEAAAGLQTGGAHLRQAPIRIALVVSDFEIVDPRARAVPVHPAGGGIEIRCDDGVGGSITGKRGNGAIGPRYDDLRHEVGVGSGHGPEEIGVRDPGEIGGRMIDETVSDVEERGTAGRGEHRQNESGGKS